MKITNEPIQENSPVKFKIFGFPEETAVRSSIERFYALKRDAFKSFEIYNEFNEQIFTGTVDDYGKITVLTPINRSGKPYQEAND